MSLTLAHQQSLETRFFQGRRESRKRSRRPSAFFKRSQKAPHLFDDAVKSAQEPESTLRCIKCKINVTADRYRIAVNGNHYHRFFNPHGLVFHIGCFSQTIHCTADSQPSAAFSWFPGFHWQVVSCCVCRYHLGWYFRNNATMDFWALIINRLAS